MASPQSNKGSAQVQLRLLSLQSKAFQYEIKRTKPPLRASTEITEMFSNKNLEEALFSAKGGCRARSGKFLNHRNRVGKRADAANLNHDLVVIGQSEVIRWHNSRPGQ